MKDKTYESTRYVIDLVAAHCVNTMPEATLNETREHGVVLGDTLTPAIAASHLHFDTLREAGIDFEDVVAFLERDGVKKFADAWQELLDNVSTVS